MPAEEQKDLVVEEAQPQQELFSKDEFLELWKTQKPCLRLWVPGSVVLASDTFFSG